MKNFKEDYTHVQRFEVLGEEIEYNNKRKKAFDLQLLPEGGNLVYGCRSNLGLKLINQNGQGIRFDAELFENENPISNLRNIKLELSNDKIYNNFLDGEVLNEVVIQGDPKWKSESRRWMESDWGEYTEIDEDFATRFPTLLDYLATKNYFRVGDRIADRPNDTERTRYPAVFLNGFKLRNQQILFTTRTQDFEEIYIDRSWMEPGSFSQNGVITLHWRKTPIFNDFDDVYPLARIVMENGFEPQKDFYTPKYKFFNTPVFEQSGTIAWFPEVSLEVGETIKLPILDTKQKNIKLFIEGITEDGSLINIEKEIEIK